MQACKRANVNETRLRHLPFHAILEGQDLRITNHFGVQMPEKILVVDDDIDSLKLIGLMLQRNGYEVIAANAASSIVYGGAVVVSRPLRIQFMSVDLRTIISCY